MARIFTNRKSGFIQRSGKMRRETAWVGVTQTSTNITTAQTAVLFGGFSAGVLALRPFTIVKILAMLYSSGLGASRYRKV